LIVNMPNLFFCIDGNIFNGLVYDFEHINIKQVFEFFKRLPSIGE